MTHWRRRKGVMLAYPFEEKRLAKWESPYIVQPKLDGARCRVVFDEGRARLLSSEENEFLTVPHINDELEEMKLFIGQELDGELYVHGWTFEQIMSVAGRSVNIHPDYHKMQLHLFDVVSESPQAQRIVELGVVKEHTHVHSSVQCVPTGVANTFDDVMKSYDDFVGMGYEGIIVRHYLAPYIRKRSTYMMKFKPKKEDIYVIVGYKEEMSQDGEPKGRLGALVCKSDTEYEFSVGTGLDDETRQVLWDSRQLLVGKYCRVQYQHTTSGKGVPRFPVFVEVITSMNNYSSQESA